MNATVIKVRGWAWKERKGGTIKLVIEVHPSTEEGWLKALEMFKGKPEISVAVVPPQNAPMAPDFNEMLRNYEKAAAAIPPPPEPVIITTDHTNTPKVDTRYDRDQSSYSKTELVETLQDLKEAIIAAPSTSGLCECGLIAGHKVKHVRKKNA